MSCKIKHYYFLVHLTNNKKTPLKSGAIILNNLGALESQTSIFIFEFRNSTTSIH